MANSASLFDRFTSLFSNEKMLEKSAVDEEDKDDAAEIGTDNPAHNDDDNISQGNSELFAMVEHTPSETQQPAPDVNEVLDADSDRADEEDTKTSPQIDVTNDAVDGTDTVSIRMDETPVTPVSDTDTGSVRFNKTNGKAMYDGSMKVVSIEIASLLPKFLEALTNDDVEWMQQCLASMTSKVSLVSLMNLEMPYEEMFGIYIHKKMFPVPYSSYLFRRPLIIAAAWASINVLKLLIEYGADVHIRDSGDNTVIHALALSAGLRPQKTEEYQQILQYLIDSMPNGEERKKIFLTENEVGLRPLEIAIKHNSYEIFKDIIELEGIYRKRLSILGLFVKNRYELHDYGFDGKREPKSPLEFLRFSAEEDLQKIVDSKIIDLPIINAWIKDTYKRNYLFLWIWIIFRVLFCLSMSPLVFANKHVDRAGNYNVTNVAPWQYWAFLAVVAVFVMIFDICDILDWLFRRRIRDQIYHDHRTRPSFVTGNLFFRFPQFGMAALCFAISVSIIHQGTANALLQGIHDFLVVFSIMYFFQMNSHFGYFIIGFRRILSSMLTFLVVFFFIIGGYVLMLRPFVCPPKYAVCTWEYTMYRTFLLMQDIEALGAITHENQTIAGSVASVITVSYPKAAIHVAFVFTISITLLNFLIAILSSTYDELMNTKATLVKLNRLEIMMLTEKRFYFVRKMFDKCKRCACINRFVVTAPEHIGQHD